MLACVGKAASWHGIGRLPHQHRSRIIVGKDEDDAGVQYPALAGQFVGYDVGRKFQLEDSREYGPWWRFLRLRSELQRVLDPKTEAGFAWHATNREGEVLFAQRSLDGNGIVRVNKHGPWRCLMFDEVEQGIAYMSKAGVSTPEVLGYQYLRTMAAAGLGFLGLPGASAGPPCKQAQRMLFVGLGTGALPGFFAHHLPNVEVECVEIDPVVVNAARTELGCNFVTGDELSGAGKGTYRVVTGDAGSHLRGLAAKRGLAKAPFIPFLSSSKNSAAASPSRRTAASSAPAELSAIFLDAFDGAGNIPAHLTRQGFLRDCEAALAPGGVLVCNVFNGRTGSKARRAIANFQRELERSVGPVATVPVLTQEESLVLVARKGRELPRPGRRDVRQGVLRSTGGSNLGIQASSLCSGLLWARSAERGGGSSSSSGGRSKGASAAAADDFLELVPPDSTANLVDAEAAEQLREKLQRGSSAYEWA